ncbi:MAG: tetratricopeptide repeat protein [bacterium]|nr:tetratricopeptide repeat protein [bacterium]
MSHRSSKNTARVLLLAAMPLVFVACQSDEEKLAAFYAQGDQYVEEDKPREAVIEYKNVLKINPNHADAHYQLAKAYMKLGRARDAYWEMSETVRLDPKNVEAVLSFGALSLVAGDGEQALSMGELALEQEPENHQGYILKGKALQSLKRESEAEEPLLRAVEFEDTSETHLILAGYYAGLGEQGRERAEPWYWKAVEKFPGPLTRTALARFLDADPARSEEAEAIFREVLEKLQTEPEVPDQENREEIMEGAYSNLARFYFSKGDHAKGAATLEEGIEVVTDSTALLFMLATHYRIQQEHDRAEELIRQATAVDPQDPMPYLVLSSFLGGIEDLEGALAAAGKALEVDPGNTDARLRRAEILVDVGFQESSASASQDPQVTLASASRANPKIDEGLKIVEEILAETPFQPQAEFVRGKAYLAKGDPEKGIEAFRAATEGQPGWAQAHFALGSALAAEGESSMARVEIARALEVDPGMHEARRLLATIHQALSEHEYAIEQGQRYLQVRPDSNATRVLVAQSLIKLGRREAALRELNKVPTDQRDAGVLFALGRVQASLGQPDQARAQLLAVLETTPHNHKVLRSLLRLDRGNPTHYPKIAALIEAAVEALPEDPDITQLGGMVKFNAGDLEGAEEAFVRAAELDPNDIEAHQQLARFYSLTGRTDETIATYERAVQTQPDSARLHHFLALLYEAQGDLDKAEQSYENAIKYDENHAFAKNNLAYLLADTGKDLDRALDLAQDAKALLPNDANAADTLGWVLFKRGVNGAAVGYLKESVENAEADDPALGVMRHHLAMAYEADGNPQRAAEVLRTALDDLEARQRAERAAGRDPLSPPWESDIRNMLERLTAS